MKKNRYKNKSENALNINFISKPMIIILVLCLTSIALIYTYDFVMQSTYFNLKKIHINGNIRVKSKAIVSLAKIKKDNNILSLNLALLQKRILSHPWVQNVSIKRSLPSTLSIELTEEIPLAIVKIDNIAQILINR
ncbi:MAG: FtsQ-type POTRA domain-containing protein, partial [Desulfobacteraceae bacterium]|nr:FtsQ-type POTRA domain-containing protein [Desulfobacteraceae bacterium]